MKSILFICAVCAAYSGLAESFKLIRSKRSDEASSRCSQPPETGVCLASFLNYYYNPSAGECETFVYGGCQGNDNNFWSKEDCEAVCKTTREDTSDEEFSLIESMEALIDRKDDCEYPPETGPCRAMFIHYYFNGEKCEEFVYGGCGANPNNFVTEEDCIERCGDKTEDENKENDV